MILAFFALRAGLIGVVKYSLLGSIVSNSIWSLGVAFLCAGRNAIFHPNATHVPIKWNRPAAGSQMSVLVSATFCFALPCVASAREDIDDKDLLGMSHYLSILLLACYCESHQTVCLNGLCPSFRVPVTGSLQDLGMYL